MFTFRKVFGFVHVFHYELHPHHTPSYSQARGVSLFHFIWLIKINHFLAVRRTTQNVCTEILRQRFTIRLNEPNKKELKKKSGKLFRCTQAGILRVRNIIEVK